MSLTVNKNLLPRVNSQIKQIQQGDVHAFGVFFRNHYARLLGYCKLFIKEGAVAEDLVQETFVNFWEKREELDPKKSVEALLFISLRNRCLNYLRDQQSARLKFEAYKGEVEQLQFLPHIDYLGEEGTSMEEQLLREVDAAIESLPDRCREVVKLSKFEGLKNREVAITLGISVKAVEKQLAVAKQKIAQYLERNYPLGLALFFLWF